MAVTAFLRVYGALLVACIVVSVTVAVLDEHADVLPWLVVLGVLVIVGRLVWIRNDY